MRETLDVVLGVVSVVTICVAFFYFLNGEYAHANYYLLLACLSQGFTLKEK